VLIRPLQTDDLSRFQEITIAAFEGVSIDHCIEQAFGTFHGHDWRWRKAQSILDDWHREPTGIFVAVIDDQVVGGITTWHDAQAGVGYIPNLAVDAAYRGQGIGRKLLEFALQHFRDLNLSVARIETLSHNATGHHLYTAVGFHEVARQIHFALPLTDANQKQLEETS